MNSTAAKTSPEILRDVDVEQLLDRRLRQDQQDARERRIERAGHLWSRRKTLGKFAAWGAAASVLIAVLIP
jgi:hypothetical protein